MHTQPLLLAIAILSGLASGPSSLESTAQSQPPIEWEGLEFAFASCLISIPIVLGFQAAIGNNKALRWGWSLFFLAAAYFTATGVYAIAVSVVGSGVMPHTLLFLGMGIALFASLAIVKSLLASKLAPTHDPSLKSL